MTEYHNPFLCVCVVPFVITKNLSTSTTKDKRARHILVHEKMPLEMAPVVSHGESGGELERVE